MKYLFTIALSIFFFTCAEKKQEPVVVRQKPPQMTFYVDNPKPNDSLCISEIERAKKDIKKGKIVFSHSRGFGFGSIRYEHELREICKKIGLEFELELFGCVIYKDQTQGCYGEYMDKVLIERSGRDFKDKIHEMADNLFLYNIVKNNTTVQYWDCDERPRLPTEFKRTSDQLPSLYQSEIELKDDGSNYGGYPFFDLGFIVEKDSSISNFCTRSYVAHNDANIKHEDELYLMVKDHIITNYPTWIPGKIGGKQVRTKNNVRLYIIYKKGT